MKSTLYRPMLAASWMIGQGVSSRSSHSAAAGRTTFSAKSWTHFWIWIWSSFSSREKSVISGAPRVWAVPSARCYSTVTYRELHVFTNGDEPHGGGGHEGGAHQVRNSHAHVSEGQPGGHGPDDARQP